MARDYKLGDDDWWFGDDELFTVALARFLVTLQAELPSYAIPLFLRLVRNLDITGSMDGWDLDDNLCHALKCFRNVQDSQTGLSTGRFQPSTGESSLKLNNLHFPLLGERPAILLQQLKIYQARLLPVWGHHQYALPPVVNHLVRLSCLQRLTDLVCVQEILAGFC